MLHCVPRYENTAVVLELSGLSKQCPAPLFELSLDGDWDESAWACVLLLISRQQKPPAPALEKALHAGAGVKNVNYSECGNTCCCPLVPISAFSQGSPVTIYLPLDLWQPAIGMGHLVA